jgi:hypothetical protein
MANFPTSLPSATPSTHGVVVNEVVALATHAQFGATYQSGYTYSSEGPNGQQAGPTTGTLIVGRRVFPPGTQIVRLFEWVTIAATAGGLRRICVYSDNGTGGYPGALLLDAGTYDSTATGLQGPAAFTALNVGGLVWIGGVATVAAASVWCHNETPPNMGWPDGGTPTNGNQPWAGWQQSGVTGALPDPFSTTRSQTNVSPRTFFKIA